MPKLQLLVVGLKIIRIFASKNNWYDIRQNIGKQQSMGCAI